MPTGFVYVTPFESGWQVVVAEVETDADGDEHLAYSVCGNASCRIDAVAAGQQEASQRGLHFDSTIREQKQ